MAVVDKPFAVEEGKPSRIRAAVASSSFYGNKTDKRKEKYPINKTNQVYLLIRLLNNRTSSCFRLATESDGNDNHDNEIGDKSQNTNAHK